MVHLSAVRGGATTAAPESIPTSKGTVTLTISQENAVALFGRVKDPAGKPVARAVVRVSARKRGVQDIPIEQFTVSVDDEGRTILRTGADGLFRTPKRLRPDLEYRVDVEAEGYAPAGTEWIKLGDRKFESIPALVLQPAAPTRTVAGQVVDARGRPVVGAAVSQSGDGPARTGTTTGADGRFRLPGVYREPAFLLPCASLAPRPAPSGLRAGLGAHREPCHPQAVPRRAAPLGVRHGPGRHQPRRGGHDRRDAQDALPAL
jgi:hypothetical protein